MKKSEAKRYNVIRNESKMILERGEKMKVDESKLELVMARACMNPADLAIKAGLPRPTLDK